MAFVHTIVETCEYEYMHRLASKYDYTFLKLSPRFIDKLTQSLLQEPYFCEVKLVFIESILPKVLSTEASKIFEALQTIIG